MYQTDCIGEIEDDFQRTLKECREVTGETIQKEKILTKIGGGFAKFIAPLM